MQRVVGALAGIFAVITIWFFLLLAVHPVGEVQHDTVRFLSGENVELPFSTAANTHLADVREVLDRFRITAAIALVLALLSIAEKTRKTTLQIMGVGLMVIPIAIAVLPWGAVFTKMHLILFPQGNWMFPASSLLIQTYPMSFFLGFAVVWGALCMGSGYAFFRFGQGSSG